MEVLPDYDPILKDMLARTSASIRMSEELVRQTKDCWSKAVCYEQQKLKSLSRPSRGRSSLQACGREVAASYRQRCRQAFISSRFKHRREPSGRCLKSQYLAQ